MSNLMGMIMARDNADDDIRFRGVNGNLIAYTSEEAHYSIHKNASFIGIGRNNVKKISTDDKGRMDVNKLENQITEDLKNGFKPFFINVTAGTTVLGAFDDIEAIAIIAKKYKLWLHVDGAYCGGVIFSKKYKHLINGIKEADSFSINAHKMLGTPLTCSIILVKNRENLRQSFSNDASYLYQIEDDDFNLGKTSLQCGRRNDALKLWTLWKSVGTFGLEKIVDKQFLLADFARNYIKNNKNYRLFSNENSLSVCFNFKNIPAEKLCTLLYQKAKLLVGFGSFKDDTFIRLVTINANNNEKEILHFFNTIEQFVSANEDLLLSKKNFINQFLS